VLEDVSEHHALYVERTSANRAMLTVHPLAGNASSHPFTSRGEYDTPMSKSCQIANLTHDTYRGNATFNSDGTDVLRQPSRIRECTVAASPCVPQSALAP
jgi:hypothetical protein